MPTNTPSLEKAKRIAAQRLASRKLALDSNPQKWTEEEKAEWKKENDSWFDGTKDKEKAKRTEERDSNPQNWTDDQKNDWKSEQDETFKGEGRKRDSDGKFASVKTALNWNQDGHEDSDSGESWDFEDQSNRTFGSVHFYDGEGEWEVYDLDDAGGMPFASGSCSSVEDGKSKAEEAVNGTKTSNKKEGADMATDLEKAREAARARVASARAAETRKAVLKKRASEVDPTPAPSDGSEDDVDTVDVTSDVPVTHVEDHTPEQHSEPSDAGSEGDGFLTLPGKAKNEGSDTMSFGTEHKKSTFRRASFVQLSELTDLYTELGVITPANKLAKVAKLEVLDSAVVQDRISLLKEVKAASGNTRSASVTSRPVPPRVANPSSPSLGRGRRPVQSSVASDSSIDALVLAQNF